VGLVGVARPAEEGVRTKWCDATSYFFCGIGIKIPEKMWGSWEGWFECAVRVSKKSSRLPSLKKLTHQSGGMYHCRSGTTRTM